MELKEIAKEIVMRPLLLILALLCPALLCPLTLWATSYSTAFSLAQSPITEGSSVTWINGLATGLDWTNVNTTTGFAVGTMNSGSSQYADSTAVLSGSSWRSNQTCIATVKVTTAPTGSGVFGEVECRLHVTVTAHSITGYEVNCSVVAGDPYMQIVRWDGPVGHFTLLNSEGTTGCVNGDVLKATIDSSGNINAYKNGTLTVSTVSPDTTFTTGNPGMGMFAQGSFAFVNDYGFSNYLAYDSNSHAAATCDQSDVNTAIGAAGEGGDVLIPPGNCTWTSGVTISGKGITVHGANQTTGAGRIVAYSSDTLTVGTGSKTVNIAGYSPGFSSSILTTGTIVDLTATGFEASYSMHGAITGFSSGVLSLNVTSTIGSGSTHRWFIATQSGTTLINNSGSTLFAVTEDTSVDTYIQGIYIQAGSGAGDGVDLNYASGGKAIVVENCRIQQGAGDSIHYNTWRGVISSCSFDSPTFSMAPIAIHEKLGAPPTGGNAWILPSYWGTLDTTGENNSYVETSDFEAYLNSTDYDDNARGVFRYNLMNNAGFGTHGADTSNYGQRYFEYYNNVGVFNGYNDGSTFNMNWWMFVRGGSFVVHDNTLPPLVSTDYGTKNTIEMITMNLQRNAGPNPCWGRNFSTAGQYYYAPRQVGQGRVTGTGTTAYPPDGVNGSTDSITYVGDIEPAYIWANSAVPLANVNTSDYGTGQTDSCSPTTDSTLNYVKINRDYFNGATTKPSYTPYVYPHPLVGGSAPPPTPPLTPTGTFVLTGKVGFR